MQQHTSASLLPFRFFTATAWRTFLLLSDTTTQYIFSLHFVLGPKELKGRMHVLFLRYSTHEQVPTPLTIHIFLEPRQSRRYIASFSVFYLSYSCYEESICVLQADVYFESSQPTARGRSRKPHVQPMTYPAVLLGFYIPC